MSQGSSSRDSQASPLNPGQHIAMVEESGAQVSTLHGLQPEGEYLLSALSSNGVNSPSDDLSGIYSQKEIIPLFN